MIKAHKRRTIAAVWSRYHTVYLMALGPVLYYIVFHYLPMPGIMLAFRKFNALDGWGSIFSGQWMGLTYFNQLFGSYYFTRTIVNTIRISLLKTLFSFPASIVFAILLDQVKRLRFKKLVQTVSYFPHFLSWVTVSSLIFTLLSPTMGIVNQVRNAMGMDSYGFLTNRGSYLAILVLSDIWKGMGWGSIVYMATIAGIDATQYEAAAIDGASRFQQVRYVTLPGIAKIASIMLILNMGSILNAGFDQSYLLLSAPVMSVGDIIDTYVFREGIGNMKYGLSTAVSLFKSLIGLVLVLSSNAIARRYETGLW